jgi:Uma2 family endonuclease
MEQIIAIGMEDEQPNKVSEGTTIYYQTKPKKVSLNFGEAYRFLKKIGTKLIYAHTTYHIFEEPDYEQLITEDDTPVDNIFSEIQQRLLIDPLYNNVWTTRKFWASANVGIYYEPNKPPIVPDMFLSFDVTKPKTWFDKKDKCYFTWLVGKNPELVVEVISNKKGKENTSKKKLYARLGVKYYVLIDPYYHVDKDKKQRLQVFELNENNVYEPLSPPYFMEEINLGIMIWDNLFEEEKAPWGRWCDREGNVLTTGAEKAKQQEERAEQEKQKAERVQKRFVPYP